MKRSTRRIVTGALTALGLFAVGCGEAPPKSGGEDSTPPPVNNPNPNNPPPAEQPAALTVSAGQPLGVCAGTAGLLQGSARGGVPPYSFHWSSVGECAGCIEDFAAPSATVLPQAPTTFRLQVTDSRGTSAFADVAVDVYALPQLAAPVDVALAPGGEALLGGAPAGTSAAWSCNRADCALSDPLAPQPAAAPERSTTYTLNVTDAHGCTNQVSSTVWVDLLKRTSFPTGEESGWPVSARLLVEFDQALKAEQLTAQNVVLRPVDGEEAIPVELSLSEDGKLLYVLPGEGYEAGRDYTLTLVGGLGGLQSEDPILPNILREDLVLSFSTRAADRAGPGTDSLFPKPDGVDFALNGAVLVSFSEPLDPASVSSTTVRLLDAEGGEVAASLRYDLASHSLVLTPSDLLLPESQYTVHLEGLADLSGNTFRREWSFTAGTSTDEAPPQLVSLQPADLALDVATTSKVKVSFDEPVSADTLRGLVVTNTATGEAVAGQVSLSAGGLSATWVPAQRLEAGTLYQVSLSGVSDLTGNALFSPFVSSFTTR